MALAVTQAVKVEAGGGTSVTLNSAWTLTPGALVVAGVFSWAGTTNIGASDSLNGFYTGRTAQDAGNPGCRFCDKNNVAGGLVNITVTCTLANGLVGLFHEVTGQDPSATVFDAESGATGTSAAPDTGAAANTVMNAIHFALVTNAGSGNPTAYTLNAAGTEGTWLEKSATQSKELDANTYPVGGVVYQIVSTIAARSHTWTMDNVLWAAASAVYKAAPEERQSSYRFRNDDGSETTATWKAAENVAADITPDQAFRLRTQIDTAGAHAAQALKLQVRKVGDASWRDIDTIG